MKQIAIIFLLVGFSASINGQKLSIDLENYPLITNGYGKSLVFPHTGIGLSYFNKMYNASIIYRSISWGSEVNLGQGIKFNVYESTNIDLENLSQVNVGIPLFHNKLSTSFGLSSQMNIKFNLFKRAYLSLGAAYNINPSYRKISSTYQFIEGMLGLHFLLIK